MVTDRSEDVGGAKGSGWGKWTGKGWSARARGVARVLYERVPFVGREGQGKGQALGLGHVEPEVAVQASTCGRRVGTWPQEPGVQRGARAGVRGTRRRVPRS